MRKKIHKGCVLYDEVSIKEGGAKSKKKKKKENQRRNGGNFSRRYIIYKS